MADRNRIGMGSLIWLAERAGIDLSDFKRRTDRDIVPIVNSPDASADLIDRMNERYAFVIIGGKAMVADTQRGELLFLEAFRAKYNNQGIGGKGAGSAWLAEPRRRTYESYEFAPDGRCRPGALNAYRGFGVDARPGEVWPWLIAFRAVIPDESVAQYALRLMALKVQSPATVTGTALVITGPKGAGKSALFRPFVRMFDPHSIVMSDPEAVVGRFNWHLRDKVFALVEEAVFVGDPRHVNKIKDRITARETTYEMKGLTPIPGTNYCLYVILTNNPHAWHATADERRAVVIEASDRLRGNQAFWDRYHRWLDTGGAAHLRYYLQSIDLTGFNPRAIPDSKYLRKQMLLTLERTDPVAAWWASVLAEECFFSTGYGETELVDNQPVPKYVVREAYEDSVRGAHVPRWEAAVRRIEELIAPGVIHKSRPRIDGTPTRMWTFPPLADMRQAFEARTGVCLW